MLVLTRKPGESLIMKDGEIEVKVMSVTGSQVRIGISAPKEISVDREEIFNLKRAGKVGGNR